MKKVSFALAVLLIAQVAQAGFIFSIRHSEQVAQPGLGFTTTRTIYLDNFSGLQTDPLNGTAPDTRPGTETWTARQLDPLNVHDWRADGSILGGTGQSGGYLPFTFKTNMIYTLTVKASITNPLAGTSGDPTHWFGLSFGHSGQTNNLTSGSFAYLLLRRNGGAQAATPGTGGSPGVNAAAGTYGVTNLTLTMKLNTETWRADFLVNGSALATNRLVNTATRDNPPGTAYVNIGTLVTPGVKINEMTLTAVLSHQKLDVIITDPPYSADPSGVQDSSPAFQTAINDLNEARGGRIYVPNGTYRFNSQVSHTNLHREADVYIRGESATGTIFNCHNTNGVLALTYPQTPRSQVTVQNVKFVAKADAQTAFAMTIQQGTGDRRALAMKNVTITNSADNHFKRGVVAERCMRPIFENCHFSGVPAASRADDSPMFYAETGFDLVDCYAPVFSNCSAYNAELGFGVHGTDGNIEDSSFLDCTTDRVKVGINHYQVGTPRATLWVQNCDITARDYGVKVYGRIFFLIKGNTFGQLSTNYSMVDCYVENGKYAGVFENQFAPTGGPLQNRVNIYLENSSIMMIQDNNITGTNPSAAITVEDDCQDIQLINNY